MIGDYTLQFQLINVQDRLVAGLWEFLGEAVGEFEAGDTIAVEWSDLPNNMVPFVILQRDGFMPALIVRIG